MTLRSQMRVLPLWAAHRQQASSLSSARDAGRARFDAPGFQAEGAEV
jgi:hypothetical protein